MALIQCPECGNKISEYADFCVNCGITMKKIREIHFNKYAFAHKHTLIEYDCEETNTYIPEHITCINQMKKARITNLYLHSKVNILSAYSLQVEGLFNIFVDELNPYLSSEDGVLFNKDKSKILVYPCGRTDETYYIPDHVTTIGEGAFRYNPSIKTVVFPKSLTIIEGRGDSYYNLIVSGSETKKINIVLSNKVKCFNIVANEEKSLDDLYEYKVYKGTVEKKSMFFGQGKNLKVNFLFYEDNDFTDEKIDELINEID